MTIKDALEAAVLAADEYESAQHAVSVAQGNEKLAENTAFEAFIESEKMAGSIEGADVVIFDGVTYVIEHRSRGDTIRRANQVSTSTAQSVR